MNQPTLYEYFLSWQGDIFCKPINKLAASAATAAAAVKTKIKFKNSNVKSSI